MTTDRMIAEGRGSLSHYPESRPVVTEMVATQRAVAMSEATGAPIYIVHLSSERALRVAEEAQARGLPIYVETRPIYLLLTQERYAEPNGSLYVGQPPLREKRDQNALWAGIAKGTIQVLGTDHLAYTREQKLDPTQTVANHRAGMSNLQEVRPMLYSEGVRTGRITLERFVAVTSTNAARLFGLYPRKGTIAVGADADLVLWDPNETRTIRDSDILSRSGFSIYAGWKVTGWPLITIRRGEVVYENGTVTGRAGSGQLIRRERWQRPTVSSPAQRAPFKVAIDTQENALIGRLLQQGGRTP
jgi:dihydropyrimidinase